MFFFFLGRPGPLSKTLNSSFDEDYQKMNPGADTPAVPPKPPKAKPKQRPLTEEEKVYVQCIHVGVAHCRMFLNFIENVEFNGKRQSEEAM